jgi:hypothetical protein
MLKAEREQIQEQVVALQQSVDFYQRQIQKYEAGLQDAKAIMMKPMTAEQVDDGLTQIKIIEELLNQYKIWLTENNELIQKFELVLKR